VNKYFHFVFASLIISDMLVAVSLCEQVFSFCICSCNFVNCLTSCFEMDKEITVFFDR